jgi:predicted nucleic acid binding AN1-type Zn finger protein
MIFFISIIIYLIFQGNRESNITDKEELEAILNKEEVRRCPIDMTSMQKKIKSGVVIDKCPICGGVFLDKHELNTILDSEVDSKDLFQ